MKSKYLSFSKLSVSILIVSSALLIQSCSNLDTENLSEQSLQSTLPQNSVFRVYDKTYNTPKGLQIWEAQLNKIIELDSNMVRNGLKLIRYEYVRKIASTTDLETVKAELKKDNSLFIVYKDNSSHFSISENKEFAKSYSNLIDSLLPTSAGILEAIRSKGDASLLAKAAYTFKKNDLGVVNLVWEYNGKTLNTQCLVSTEKGIVFDKFLFSIHTTVNKTTSTKSNFSKAPQDWVSPNWVSVEKVFRDETIIYDYFGYEMLRVGIQAAIYGGKYNGICYVTQAPSVSNWANSISDYYKCASFCRILSFSPTIGGTDEGHLQFEYGIIAGHDVEIHFEGDYPVIFADTTTVPPLRNEYNNVTLLARDMY